MVQESWPENGLEIGTALRAAAFKFKQSPVFGHETVARKWAQNPDRVFGKKHTQNPHKLSLGRASRPVQDRSLQAVSLMPRNTLTTHMGQA